MSNRFDVRDQLSAEQAIVATAVSTNSKKKPANQDLGIGCKDAGLVFFATVAATGTSVTVEIVEADDAALTSNVTSIASLSVLAADLIPGKGHFLQMPPYKSSKEYYGVRYTPVGGATVTMDAYWGARQDVANFKSFTSTYQIANT